METLTSRVEALEKTLADLSSIVRFASANATPSADPRWPDAFSTPQMQATAIAMRVANLCRVKLPAIYARDRSAHLVYPRHLCFYLCRKFVIVKGEPISFPMLGLLFRRDQSGVQHGVRRIENFITTDRHVKEDVEFLESEITKMLSAAVSNNHQPNGENAL